MAEDPMQRAIALFGSDDSTERRKGLVVMYKHICKSPADFAVLVENKDALNAFYSLADTVDSEQQTFFAACMFAICKDDSNWTPFLESGGLEVVAVLLSSDVGDVLGHSVTTVAMLSQDDGKHVAMADAGVCLPLLKIVLHAQYERLAEQAAACISNLAAIHDYVKAKLHSFDALQAFEGVVVRFKTDALVVRVLGSIANLVSLDDAKSGVVEGPLLDEIMAHTGSENEEIQTEALRCVCTLLEDTKWTAALIEAGALYKCVPSVEALQEGRVSIEAARFALRICANIAVCSPETAVAVVVQCGKTVFASTHVDDETTLLIAAMVYTNMLVAAEVVAEFVAHGGLDGLANLIATPYPDVVSQALRAVSALTMLAGKQPEVLMAVADNSVICQTFFAILEGRIADLHKEALRQSLSAVSNMLANQDTRAKLTENNGIRPDSVGAILDLCQTQDDDNVQFLAFRSLTYLSMVPTVVDKLVHQSGLEEIILPLSHSDVSNEVMYYGAAMLGNFAVKPKVARAIVDIGGAGVLMNMAAREDKRLQTYVLAAVGNLAASKENHRTLIDNGCVQMLIDALTDENATVKERSQIKTFAVRALADLASTDVGREEMISHPAMKAALDSTDLDDKAGKKSGSNVGMLYNSELSRLKFNLKVGWALEEARQDSQIEEEVMSDEAFRTMSLAVKSKEKDLDSKVKRKAADMSKDDEIALAERNRKHGWDGEVKIGDCVFEERVGLGSYGEVFKGKHQGDTVAIKKLWHNKMKDDGDIAYFLHEVKVMRMFKVHSIVEFRGACTVPPNLLLITEFMNGGNLSELTMDHEREFPWPVRLRLLADGAHGLAHMHSHDPPILHRDLKPENLLLTDQGDGLRAKIADFGLSKIKDNSHTMTVCGTPAFMAPEVLRGESYNLEADVYSFGCIMWQVATRKQLFDNLPPFVAAMKVAYEDLHPPMPSPQQCPFGFVRLMERCLDHRHMTRPRMSEVLMELETILTASKK